MKIENVVKYDSCESAEQVFVNFEETLNPENK